MLALAIIATVALVVVAASAVVACAFAFVAMRAALRTEEERRTVLAASVQSMLSQQAAIDALASHLEEKAIDDEFGLEPKRMH